MGFTTFFVFIAFCSMSRLSSMNLVLNSYFTTCSLKFIKWLKPVRLFRIVTMFYSMWEMPSMILYSYLGFSIELILISPVWKLLEGFFWIK